MSLTYERQTAEDADYGKGDAIRHRRKRLNTARRRRLVGRLWATRSVFDLLADPGQENSR